MPESCASAQPPEDRELPAYLTPAQTAQRLGVNRSTVSRMLAAGEIRGMRDNSGRWRIDPADLPETPKETPRETPEIDTLRADLSAARERIARLEGEAVGAAELLAGERGRRESAEKDRDEWREIANRLSRAAEAPAPPRASSGTETGIFSRLFGKKRRQRIARD